MPHLLSKLITNSIRFTGLHPALTRPSRPTLLTTMYLASLHLTRSFSTPALTTLTLRTDTSLIPHLLPLLTSSQLLQIPQHPLSHPQPTNPSSIHTLTLLPGLPADPPPWHYLEAATANMHNLHHIIWETPHGTTTLAETIANLPLTHVSCIASSPLCKQRMKNLVSFTIFHTRSEEVTGLTGILAPSAGSLESLHLAFRGAGVDVEGMLDGVDRFERLRCLRLGGYDGGMIAGLKRVVDFRALETLQLVREGVLPGLGEALGGLDGVVKLSGVMVPSQVVDVVARCKGLEELHVVYGGEADPEVVERAGEKVVEAVGRHGGTLKALSLHAGYAGGVGARGTVLGVREVERLVGECAELEDLRVNVRVEEFEAVVEMLSRLRGLKNLYLDLEEHPTGARFDILGVRGIVPLSKPWFDSDELEGPRNQITPFERGLDRVLAAFREVNLNHVCFSSIGIDPSELEVRMSQCYHVSEGVLPGVRDEYEVDILQYWNNQWVAPKGQRFRFEGGVEAEVVDGIMNENVGRWASAFKAAAGSTIRWEKVLM